MRRNKNRYETHRITFMFTTEKNLKVLDQYHDRWLGDGTFDIAPTFFNNRCIPFTYWLMEKLFRWLMVSCHTQNKQPTKNSLK